MSRARALASLAAAGVLCAGIVAAQGTKPDPKKVPSKPMPTPAVKLMTQAGLKWEVDPESKISIAVLSGNPKTAPYEAFIKFPAGTAIPLHWHTFTNTAVGVSGTLVVEAPGQPPIELGAGSWGVVPGMLKHTTKCKQGADCVIYARQPGKDDTHFVGAPPPKK